MGLDLFGTNLPGLNSIILARKNIPEFLMDGMDGMGLMVFQVMNKLFVNSHIPDFIHTLTPNSFGGIVRNIASGEHLSLDSTLR